MIRNIKRLILIIFALSSIKLFEYTFAFNLPILRYLIIVSGCYLVLKSIQIKQAFTYQYKSISSFLIIALLIFLAYSILSGFEYLFSPNRNYLNLKAFLGNYALLYSFPLLVFLKPDVYYWKYFVKYSYFMLFLLLPFLAMDIGAYLSREKSPEGIVRAFAGVSGFLLLLGPYFKAGKRNAILAIFFISLLFMVYYARRNMVLYFGSFFVVYYYLSFFSKTLALKFTRIKNFFNTIVVFMIAGAVYLFSTPDFSLFFERVATGMESREGVIDEFFMDIQPFSSEFFIGRGMYGTFFSKNLGFDDAGQRIPGGGARNLIENGYLQIILNFGFIFLFSFFVLSLIGFFKSFFKSNNLLARACGAVLLINLIDMVGYGLPEISFKYLLVWFSFAYCFSKEFRNLDDFQIKKVILGR